MPMARKVHATAEQPRPEVPKMCLLDRTPTAVKGTPVVGALSPLRGYAREETKRSHGVLVDLRPVATLSS